MGNRHAENTIHSKKVSKILLVEDDVEIAAMIQEYFSGSGYEIVAQYTAEQAESWLHDHTPALALVDLMLPERNGFYLIQKIRERQTFPIIILTARNSDSDKTRGFRLGADDYVTKPFSLVELEARVKTNIRRCVQYDDTAEVQKECIRLQDLIILPDDHRVMRGETDIPLTAREFSILLLLAKYPDRTWSKKHLFETIWREPYLNNDYVLNSHMNRLRKKLDDGSGRQYIQTLWRIGYRVMEAEH